MVEAIRPDGPLFFLLTLAVIVIGAAGPSRAGQLSVEPILLEMSAPAATGILKLRNDDTVEVTAQTRILRWTQVDGVEKLEPTTDVVSSPPAVALAPKIDYVVRIVRVSRNPSSAKKAIAFWLINCRAIRAGPNRRSGW